MAILDYCIDIAKVETCNILSSEGVDFLVSSQGKVPFFPTSSDGKTVICLYFSANWGRPCKVFTPKLLQAYKTINSNNKKLVIILVSSDHSENEYREQLKTMPWLAIPFDPVLSRRLTQRLNVTRIPSLIPLSGGDIYSDSWMAEEENAVDLVEDYGSDAFPFTRMRRHELKARDDVVRSHGIKVEDLLAHVGNLVSRNGREVLVSKLAGKTVGIYFGAHWCPPSCSFTKQLTETYNLIVTAHQPFEVVFVSADRDEDEFELCLSEMPWLAIPYKDEKTRADLRRIFEVKKIPSLVVVAPDNGKVITVNGRSMVSSYGALAFPFTDARIKVIEDALDKERQRLPRTVQDPRHQHELKLDMAKAYVCDACGEKGRFCTFSCDECDFDLHPACVDSRFGIESPQV